MTKLKNDTLVVVADGEKALFLRNLTDGDNPNLDVEDKDTQDNPSDREQSANRPGRVSQSANHGKSAYDDTDWHELAKDRFAAELSDKLYKMAHSGEFERLVLVASPKILGELRDQMHQVVTDKIVGEIPKTLTNHPVNEIEDIVKNDLAA